MIPVMQNWQSDVDDISRKSLKWIFIFMFFSVIIDGIGWCAHAVFYPVNQAQQVVEKTLNVTT